MNLVLQNKIILIFHQGVAIKRSFMMPDIKNGIHTFFSLLEFVRFKN